MALPSKARFRILAALLVGLLPAVANAAYLVVRSTGPSSGAYPPGKRLRDGAEVLLRPGDRLTVLGLNRARELRGPANFTVAPDVQLVTALDSRGRFGSRRGPSHPSIWDIDVASSATICINPSSRPALWRSNAANASRVTIDGGPGKVASMEWQPGVTTLLWPQSLPLADGDTYRIRLGEGSGSAITFVTMPTASDQISLAETMLQRGCSRQVQRLVDDMLDPARP